MSNLETKALVVNLDTSFWNATKSDRALAQTLESQFEASDGAARVRKQLINHDALRPVFACIQNAKAIHKSMTLPWNDHGERLLPVNLLDNYKRDMDAAVGKVEQARRTFVETYDQLVEKAKVDLGGMFRESDYPASGTVAGKFGVKYEFSPVPSAKHFIADIGAEEAERIKRDLERRVQVKLDAAMVNLYEQIEAALQRLIERLGLNDDGSPKRVHATAVDALRTLAESVPSLNLTNDKRLIEISERIKSALEAVEVSELRHRSKKTDVIAAVNQRRDELAGELGSIAEMYFGPQS